MTYFDLYARPAVRWFYANRLIFFKIAVVTVVLLSGFILAPRAALGYRKFLLPVILCVGVFFLYGFLRWPVLGLFLTIIGCFFIPFSGPGGFNVSELGIAGLLGVWFLDMLVIKRKFSFVNSRTIIPVFLLSILSIMSFSIGQFPWFYFANHAPITAQVGGLAIFLLSFGAFLLVAHLVQDQRWLERLTWVFLSIGAIYVFGRIIHAPVDRYFIRSAIANAIFWTWLITLSFSQAWLNGHLRLHWRIMFFILTLSALYIAVVVNYDWKSGWVPPLAGMAAIICFRYWRTARVVAPFVLIPAVIYVATKAISTDQYSWGTRLDAWFIIIEIGKVSPILGLGFGNYHFYTPLYSFRGYISQFNSHSQYVDLFAQVGLVGLVLYTWFFGEIGYLGWWLRERVPEGFARSYVYAALGGIVGTLVAGFLVDWVLPFVYNIGLEGFRTSVLTWIFMGGLVTLEQIERTKTQVQGTISSNKGVI
jgi:hypothetical protein